MWAIMAKLVSVSNRIAEYFFKEIEKNITEAERCWNAGDASYATYMHNVRRLLDEFHSMFND